MTITKLRAAAQKQEVYHYTPVNRIGYSGVLCWCGATLWLHYSEKARDRKLRTFQMEHDECQGPGGQPE